MQDNNLGNNAVHVAARLSGTGPSPMMMLAARAADLRAQGRNVISLATGEPDFDTPSHIQDAAVEAMRKGDTHYTFVDGTKAAKAAVRDKFLRENELSFDENEVGVYTGGKHVIFNALSATVDPGDEVLFGLPTFPSYIDAIRYCGGVPVGVETQASGGWKLTPDSLDKALSPKTRWVILNSPSNPTGSAYSRAELHALAAILLRYPQVLVLSDDIYEHLLYSPEPFATIAQVEPKLASRTLTMNGLSKAYSMTGWRIAYAGGPAWLVKAMATVASITVSCPSSISQAAAVAALTGPQDARNAFAETFRQRRDLFVASLNQAPHLRCPLPDGAFYVFPSCEAAIGLVTPKGKRLASDADFAEYILDEANVAIVPGSTFGAPGHFRASFALDTQQLLEAAKRIKKATEALS
ncbi:MAG: pyridoxal phosphate-dependent aminotransferase [Rhizobiaceae bacterium]|nr:pyridoxal phosphate-dependent aminotransferase [Rhizobiaceae bacterium]